MGLRWKSTEFVYDADTALNVVQKPSATKVPSFDGDIVVIIVVQKRHHFSIKIRCISLSKEWTLQYYNNKPNRPAPPFIQPFPIDPPPSISRPPPGTCYVKQHNITRSSGNSRQLAPPPLVLHLFFPPSLPPALVYIRPRILIKWIIKTKASLF